MDKLKASFLSLISLVIILSLIISSCNITNKVVSSGFIQKRKYNKGYFVNIFPKKQKVANIKAVNEKSTTEFSDIPPLGQGQKHQKIEYIDVLLFASADDVKQKVNNTSIPVPPDERIIQQKQNKGVIGKTICKLERRMISPFPKDSKVNEPKMNGFAYASFLCALVMPASLILAALLSTSGLGALIILFYLIVLISPICAIIFSINGQDQIKKDPTKWKGKGFAIAGLILGIAETFLILLGIILLIIDLHSI